MQNKMVQALMYEREKLFQNIFNVANKPSANKDITIVMKMKKELINLVKQNHDLINKYNGLKTKALKLIEMVKELKEENERLQEPNNGDLERSEYTHDVKLFNHRQNAQNAPQHIPNVSHHMSNVPQHMPTVFNHATPQTVNEQHGDQVNITETEQHYDNYIQKENDSSDMDNKTLVIPNTSNYNDHMITPPESTQYIHSDHQNSPVSPGGVITLNPAELIIASNESEHPVANEQPVVAQQPENAIVQTSDVISPDNVSFFQGVDIN
jgi:hypothetical protein